MRILRRTATVAAVLAFLALAGYISARQLFRRMERDVSIRVKASDEPSQIAPLLEGLKHDPPAGDIVFLRQVRIESGPAAGLFFAVDQRGSKIVVFSNSATMSSLTGKIADLTGTLARFPSLATMERQWKLEKKPTAEMRQEGAYIRADRVWLAAHARQNRNRISH